MRRTPDRRVYTVAEVAKEVGCHPNTIRLAEAEGRVPPPRRDEIGARVYTRADCDRLKELLRR